MNKRYLNITLIGVGLFFFTGCAVKKVKTEYVKKSNVLKEKFNKTNNYNHFRFKPIIGTRQEDTKVMVDMGKYAKIWIKNYKNNNDYFISSHDIIVQIREPGFISGEDVPSFKRRAVKKTFGSNSFAFRSKDLLTSNSDMNTVDTKTRYIKDYVNNNSKEQKEKKLIETKRNKLNKFDHEIKNFLKNEREIK